MKAPAAVGIAGLLVGIGLAFRLLVPAGWDPSVVGAFGEESDQRLLAEQVLGREPALREALGHDGRFFFVQAQDPLYLDPATAETWLDRPLYRAQRMLYPLVSSVFGLVSGAAVLWGMLVVNVLAMAAGAWTTARLAADHGASAWWGLAFPLNIGLINEFDIGGAGVVAFGLAVVCVLLLERERPGLAGLALSLSVLAREAMIVFALGLFLYRWTSRERVNWAIVVAPIGAAAAWAGYLRLRLPGVPTSIEEIGLPFAGLVRAIPLWDGVDWLLGAVLLYVAAILVLRGTRHPTALGWGSMGFIVLAVLFTRQVWVNSYDITRAVAPVITAYVFASFVDRPRRMPVPEERPA